MKSSWMFISLCLLLSLTVYPQDFQITIDAEKDAFYNTLTGPDNGWFYIPPAAFISANGAMPSDEADLSANWYSAWDDTYLYVYVNVVDNSVKQDNGANYWANDCFDAKMDPDVNSEIDNEVFCFTMTCTDSFDVDPALYPGIADIYQTVGGGWPDPATISSITPDDYARQITDNGYILECRVKWEWIATTTKGPTAPEVGAFFGFAVSIHDNDSTAGREASIQWSAGMNDNVWSSCTNMGYFELLADHKIRYAPESIRDPSITNLDPDMYNPTATAVSQQSSVVKSFALSQNYPNPFNPATTISYTLQEQSEVKLSVYDVLGHEVAILVNGMKPSGTHTLQFRGSNLSSGIYLYKLQSEGKVITKKMALMK